MRKFILTAILLLGLTFPAGAQQFYEITDFSKLLQSHVSPYLTGKGSAVKAFNVRANKEYGALVKRDKRLLYSQCRTAPVKSIHRYYRSDNTEYTLATSSTFLDYVDDDGNCTELKSALTDGKRWAWVTYKDIAIGTNGSDSPIKWDGESTTTANTDGARTAGDLVADLGAPFAELNTGTDLDASSWYQYRIAYYDGTTYSYSEARSNPILTGSSVHNITLSDIPLGPSGTTQRIIYRTVGDASKAAVLADTSFYRVATISDNSTRTYNDAISDATILSDTAPTWATVSAGTDATPPKSRFGVIHKEKLFLANDPSGITSGKSIIYWSDTLNPDYIDVNTDYELIRPDDGDEITFITNLLGILTIGKTNSIQKIYTDNSDDSQWVVSDPFTFIGCVAPYSMANATTGIIYRGRHGLYMFNGQRPELISDVVTDHIRDALETSIGDMVGAYHDNQYLLAYTSKETGAADNDRVLILDTVRNAYAIDLINVDSFVVFDSNDDFGELYSGSSTTDGKIFAHSGTFSGLQYRYKSELEGGTIDSVLIAGIESSPFMELGWGVTIDSATYAGVTLDSAVYASGTIDRPSTTGYWYSPVVQVSANNYDKLYWNEDLGSFGDVTFAIRSASSSAGVDSATWSSEVSDPSGSDLSGFTANDYTQLRATLSTTDITTTPQLYLENFFVIKMSYNRSGAAGAESSILSLVESGWDNFGDERPKIIKEIQVFYTGDTGTLTIGYDNAKGSVDASFDIDLTVNPTASSQDHYFGTEGEKIFVHYPSLTNQPSGRNWKFTITDNGIEEWKIRKIIVVFDQQPYVSYR